MLSIVWPLLPDNDWWALPVFLGKMNLIKAYGGKGSWPFSFERSATSPPQADHVLVDLFSSMADGGLCGRSPPPHSLELKILIPSLFVALPLGAWILSDSPRCLLNFPLSLLNSNQEKGESTRGKCTPLLPPLMKLLGSSVRHLSLYYIDLYLTCTKSGKSGEFLNGHIDI